MRIRHIVAGALLAATIPTSALGAAARKTSGTVYASVTHAEGSDLYVSGDFKDKLLGRGGIVYTTRVSAGQTEGSFNVTARKITIYTTAGSLTGTGSATQTISADAVTVTGGKFKLTKGTGKLKGHRLTGTFSGDQVNGVYKFTYSATYR
jgi:hypothetical protein